MQAEVKALNRRDAPGALAMMHPDAPDLARIRATTEQITAVADLLYILRDLQLESADENEAKVRFTMVTQKVSGPEFRNNRVEGIRTLKKHHGEWKNYSTQVSKVEFLDNR